MVMIVVMVMMSLRSVLRPPGPMRQLRFPFPMGHWRNRRRMRRIPALRKLVRKLLVQSSVETIRRQATHRTEFVAFAVAVSAHAARSMR